MTNWILDRSSTAETFVLDSWPFLETLRRGRDIPRMHMLLRQAALGNVRLLMSEVNQGEIFYTVAADRGEAAADRLIEQMSLMPITIVPVLAGDGLWAGRLKARLRISLADCFCLIVAQRYGATLVTGDDDFRKPGFATEVALEWLGA